MNVAVSIVEATADGSPLSRVMPKDDAGATALGRPITRVMARREAERSNHPQVIAITASAARQDETIVLVSFQDDVRPLHKGCFVRFASFWVILVMPLGGFKANQALCFSCFIGKITTRDMV